MPFDGTEFRGPIRPDRSPPQDRFLTAALLAVALILVLMPISIAALADLIVYLRRL